MLSKLVGFLKIYLSKYITFGVPFAASFNLMCSDTESTSFFPVMWHIVNGQSNSCIIYNDILFL